MPFTHSLISVACIQAEVEAKRQAIIAKNMKEWEQEKKMMDKAKPIPDPQDTGLIIGNKK